MATSGGGIMTSFFTYIIIHTHLLFTVIYFKSLVCVYVAFIPAIIYYKYKVQWAWHCMLFWNAIQAYPIPTSAEIIVIARVMK